MVNNKQANACLIIALIYCLMLPGLSIGQHHFRMKADFSIKEKFLDGKLNLTMGTVYYDRTYKKLVYQIKFPEKETWVIVDSVFYQIQNGKLKSKLVIPYLPASTVFEYALISNFDNFGLEKSLYKIGKVEKDGDMVISTWNPDKQFSKALGRILISKKANKLFGIAFYTPANELVKKQFFRGYVKSGSVIFPEEITEIMYKTVGKETKISTFKNLVVNDLKDDSIYNFPIPASK